MVFKEYMKFHFQYRIEVGLIETLAVKKVLEKMGLMNHDDIWDICFRQIGVSSQSPLRVSFCPGQKLI